MNEKNNITVLVLTSDSHPGGYYFEKKHYANLLREIKKLKIGESAVIKKRKVSREFLDMCAAP